MINSYFFTSILWNVQGKSGKRLNKMGYSGSTLWSYWWVFKWFCTWVLEVMLCWPTNFISLQSVDSELRTRFLLWEHKVYVEKFPRNKNRKNVNKKAYYIIRGIWSSPPFLNCLTVRINAGSMEEIRSIETNMSQNMLTTSMCFENVTNLAWNLYVF